MKVGERTLVSLSYELTVDGKIADSAGADAPLRFVFGTGCLLPKFEENIEGLEKGDRFAFTLTPSEGYGEVVRDAVAVLPKSAFMVDGTIAEDLLTVGNQIPMSTADGRHLIGIVTEVGEDAVHMDFNHPMAGRTLHFTGEIVDVREATDEEITDSFGCSDTDCGCCGGDCSC